MVGKQKKLPKKVGLLTFTLYQKQSDTKKIPIEATCTVVNGKIYDFQLKCNPKSPFLGSIYESTSQVLDDTIVNLNLTEGKDSITITDVGKNNNKYYFSKRSSGLSSVAITFIVIACTISLLIVSLIAISYNKQSKVVAPANYTVIQKYDKNYTE